MTRATFLDTNILIYHLLQEHPEYSPRCTALMIQLGDGRISATCTGTVIFETVYFLEKTRRIPRPDIHPPLRDVLSMRAIEFEHREALLDALDFWNDNPPLSFADCYHLALASHLNVSRIYTFDKKMDRYPGVERVEP